MLVMFDVVVLACDVSFLGECSKCDNITSYYQRSSSRPGHFHYFHASRFVSNIVQL